MAIAGFGGVRPPDLGDRRPTGLTGTATPRTKPVPYAPPTPNAPTGFGGTAGISIYDPNRRGGGGEPSPRGPWDEPRKGEPGFGGTPAPTPTEAAPTPEPEPQTFFEKFPTPQDAWKDWLGRMGKFLARQPGETPNFPGPWGDRSSALAGLPSGRYEGPLPYTWEMAMQPHGATFGGIGGRMAPPSDVEYDVNKALF